ncbi:MAG TPA: UDP-4-amino-4,6-dideoxy-N-acetyl-beta-L-altrosamine transaminase [Solirubrobacteraceae bacterium]|nr:UDP-4-amino-4,6-dideoxy-N-acetyl-beta-L-altrosamine transaminase [Solirubrobacteraceae bacterium]
MPIPYGRQTIEDDDVAAVVEVLRGDWLTQGPNVRAFEEACAAACDAPHAVAFSSGTSALHAAAHVADLKPGDELMTSAITFAASANCGAYTGAKPTFADIDPGTWNVSASTVADTLTPRTRAVVPVHFAGLPAPIAEIRATVGEGVTIIEDAAHAIGARTPEGPVGACRHSDMTAFSFHPVKTITSGEGGMVSTRSSELARRLREFRTHGIVKDPQRLRREDGGWYAEQQELGFNYRLTDLQSALGRSQLAKLERFIARRNEVAGRYRDLLGDIAELELAPAAPPGARHAYHLFVVRHREGTAARRRLYDGLHERGILAQVHYLPVYRHPFYQDTYGYTEGQCPAAEAYYAGCLSLPCFPALTDAQQELIATAVRELV